MLDRVIVNKSLTEATVITDDKTYKLFSSSGNVVILITEFLIDAHKDKSASEDTEIIETQLSLFDDAA